MRNLFLTALSTTLLVLSGCMGGSGVHDFNRSLDNRIQGDLAKRKALVASNPSYVSLVSDLDEGRKLLLNGQPADAFVAFDKILQNARYTNFPEYSYAKYYLAAALYELGVDYGALLYFVDIVQKEPLKMHTHESLRRAISIAQNLKDDELILYLASSITPDKVPLSLREEFRYFIGKDLYQKEDFAKAAELLGSIPHRNRLYLAAQYLLGTIAVRKDDLRQATKHFQNISTTRSPVAYYEKEKIRELGSLALGRIFYEQKNYPLSIVHYKKVTRDGGYFPVAMYESSWGLFKLHKYNEALSVLHSLNSPFFEQIYFLKSRLLKGAIFLELCYYDDAVGTLSQLEGQFSGLKVSIDKFAREARSPTEYYQLLQSRTKTEEGAEGDYRYKELFELAAANRDFLGVHRYIRRLDAETDFLKTVKSPRAELLAKLLEQKSGDLKIKASWLAGKKLRITREMIGDFLQAKDMIRYEIVSAERKILQTRFRGLASPVIGDAELIKPEFTESLRQTLNWWDYNGEYWEDEIGSYLYDLPTKCKGEATPKK